MKKRHQAREIAFQILYQYDVDRKPVPESPDQLAEELKSHFEHFKVPDELQEFAAQLVSGTLLERAKIDETIKQYAKNWKLERMNLIDRNLLRMGIYELQNISDIPTSVTIDEAVELGKAFGTTDTSAFVNGILDAIVKKGSEK